MSISPVRSLEGMGGGKLVMGPPSIVLPRRRQIATLQEDAEEEKKRTTLRLPGDTPVPMPSDHWQRVWEGGKVYLVGDFTHEEVVFALAWADFTTGRREVEHDLLEEESSSRKGEEHGIN